MDLGVIISIGSLVVVVLIFFANRNSKSEEKQSKSDVQARDSADSSLGRSIDRLRDDVEKIKETTGQHSVTIRESVYSIEKLEKDMQHTFEKTTTEHNNKIEKLCNQVDLLSSSLTSRFDSMEQTMDKKDKQLNLVLEKYGEMFGEFMRERSDKRSGS